MAARTIGFVCEDIEGPGSSKRLFAGQAGEKLNVKFAELCVDGCGKPTSTLERVPVRG